MAGPEIALGALGGSIVFMLRRAQAAVTQELHAAFADDTSRFTQYAILHLLALNPGLRQSQVCDVLGLRRANIVPMLDALEQRGLAQRRPAPADRRAKGLFLTEAGMALLDRLTPNMAAQYAALAARLGGGTAKAALLDTLQKLTDPAPDLPA